MNEIEEKRGLFYLGKQFDLASNQVGQVFSLDANHLTTHGAILGMTGSGKTGLGITLLEEALLDGVPAIILDPKGDITNLALMFPDLTPQDLLPWIAPEDAQMHELTLEAYAERMASTWRDERARWDITPERVRQMLDAGEVCIYTPGSDAGAPVDVLQSLQAPSGEWAGYDEEMRERIQGLVSALLGLPGMEADPVQSREHILLAHLFEYAWKVGRSLDLPALLGQIQRPPIQRLGVFELEAFFPEKDRIQLAGSLNHLIASPGFEAWRQGEPLDVDSLLCRNGKPRASIFYLAHLDDTQRMFFVTLLLSQVRGWLRRQRGATTLRAILYFDEIFGYCPPYPKNPPSKVPLLSLVKQARAMGLGVVAIESSFALQLPTLPPDVRQYFLPATAAIEWSLRQWEEQNAQTILIERKQLVYEPHLLGIATVRFSDRRLAVPFQRTVTRLVPMPAGRASADWGAAGDVAVDRAMLTTQPPGEAQFAELPPGAITARTLAAFERDFAGYVYRDVSVSVTVHPQLKSAGIPNESPREFRARAESEVRVKRDAEIAQVKSKYQREIARVEKQLRKEERELEQDKAELAGRKREETLGLAESVFNFLAGRRQSYAVSYAARRRRQTQATEADVQESEDAIVDLEEMLDQLRSALDDEVNEVNRRWASVFDNAQQITLKARKSDISVDAFGLAWVPFWYAVGKVGEVEQKLRLPAYDVAGG
jgi:hypothetical protein